MNQIGSAPEKWLFTQILRPDFPAILEKRPTSAKQIAQFVKARRSKNSQDANKKQLMAQARNDVQSEITWRTLAAVQSKTPFAERLVHFWSNHFTVSATKPRVGPLVGAFEREAIRPNLGVKFEQLLTAAVLHPAMLVYLDNERSTGPNSRAGLRRSKGLNENLAREVLELHTLGVNGGYTQRDVIALAKMLTGWTISAFPEDADSGVQFLERMHEPGKKEFLGRSYPENGPDEIRQALRDLAQHPSTARFVAQKLARHFIADSPPPEAIKELAAVFQGYGGNLEKTYKTLLGLDASWDPALRKVKSPHDLLISSVRACGQTPVESRWGSAFQALGQPTFAAPSPAGWPDTAEHWLSPDAVINRLELCRTLAYNLPQQVDPRDIAEQALGDLLSETTKQEISRAPSAQVGLALLFASPEFQRR